MSNQQLRYIDLPQGKTATDTVAERHDIVLLFDATKCNPNGDPDGDNMPRLQPNTLRGLVTDGCLKRKIRNFFSMFKTNGELLNGVSEDDYQIFVREGAVFQNLMEDGEDGDDLETRAKKSFENYADDNKGKWEKPSRGKASKNEFVQRAYNNGLCQKYFDVRAFGGVVATEGPLKASFYGQIRGPIQFSYAESIDRVLQLDTTITRCAVASKKEAEGLQKQQQSNTTDEATGGNRTMGRRRWIDYGLYRTHIYFSPAFAAKTKFTYRDLDNLFFALERMFWASDASAGRTGMRVVGIVDFQHSTALGNAPAHKLFNLIKVERAEDAKEKDFPESLNDYLGSRVDGSIRVGQKGELTFTGKDFTSKKDGALQSDLKSDSSDNKDNENDQNIVKANSIVWEIPSNETDIASSSDNKQKSRDIPQSSGDVAEQ